MQDSLFSKKMAPWKQAAYVFVGAFAFMLLGFFAQVARLLPDDDLFAWSIATAFMLLFALFNSVMSLNADSFTKYWGQSMYSFAGLAFLNGLAAWMFSGVSINAAGSYKFIYLVVTFGFLVFLSLVNFMKVIVRFAEREEWTQPRKRN